MIERKKSVSQRPIAVANLKIRNIRFIDDNRNHVIDAGENSKVVFEIVNEGRTPVYDVVPAVEEVTRSTTSPSFSFSPADTVAV